MANKNHGQEQAKVLTSDEMNYLIYRYLQECGECGESLGGNRIMVNIQVVCAGMPSHVQGQPATPAFCMEGMLMQCTLAEQPLC